MQPKICRMSSWYTLGPFSGTESVHDWWCLQCSQKSAECLPGTGRILSLVPDTEKVHVWWCLQCSQRSAECLTGTGRILSLAPGTPDWWCLRCSGSPFSSKWYIKSSWLRSAWLLVATGRVPSLTPGTGRVNDWVCAHSRQRSRGSAGNLTQVKPRNTYFP